MEPYGGNLVFIICGPRTGSTLLQQILASHSEMHTLAPPCIMLPLVYGLRNDNGLKPIGIEAEYDAPYANQNIRNFLNQLPGKNDVFYEGIRKAALHMYGMALEGTGKKYFIDKSIRYYSIAPELIRTFPSAKFIVLHRNPISQFASHVKAWIKDGGWMRYRVRYQNMVRSHFFLRDAINIFGDRVARVRYEDLVSSPEATIRRLCEFIGVFYEEQMINYGQRIKGMSSIELVGSGDVRTLCKHNKPVTDYTDNWPDLLSTSESVFFAKCAMHEWGKNLFDDLGYSYNEAMNILNELPFNEDEIHVTWNLISDIELSDEIKNKQAGIDKIHSLLKPKKIPILKKVKVKRIDSSIVNVWECRYGVLKGLMYAFNADGTFERVFTPIDGVMKGTYSIDDSVTPHLIDLNVIEHHAGEANLGIWKGIFEVEGNLLKIRYNPVNKPRWEDTSEYYYRYKYEPH